MKGCKGWQLSYSVLLGSGLCIWCLIVMIVYRRSS